MFWGKGESSCGVYRLAAEPTEKELLASLASLPGCGSFYLPHGEHLAPPKNRTALPYVLRQPDMKSGQRLCAHRRAQKISAIFPWSLDHHASPGDHYSPFWRAKDQPWCRRRVTFNSGHTTRDTTLKLIRGCTSSCRIRLWQGSSCMRYTTLWRESMSRSAFEMSLREPCCSLPSTLSTVSDYQ